MLYGNIMIISLESIDEIIAFFEWKIVLHSNCTQKGKENTENPVIMRVFGVILFTQTQS